MPEMNVETTDGSPVLPEHIRRATLAEVVWLITKMMPGSHTAEERALLAGSPAAGGVMIDRFRVATRATGIRREVYVHIYDDRDELARAHQRTRGRTYEPERDGDIAGGVASMTKGYHWPKPDGQIWLVMRLWTHQLTTRTIAHEATHAAACMTLFDVMPGWDSRLRTFLNGDNEPMAYAVGDIAAEVVAKLYARGHLSHNDRPELLR